LQKYFLYFNYCLEICNFLAFFVERCLAFLTMNVSLFIARRYFTARRKKSFISLISNISMLGVGVGTMALIIVLSVFNGMEDLNRQLFKSFDADLKITPSIGKRFESNETLLQKIRQTTGVQLVTPIIEDNALARYADRRAVVKLKGVDTNYLQRHQLDNALLDGQLMLMNNNEPQALVGITAQNALSLNVSDFLTPLELWYPRNTTTTLRLNSPDAFNQQLIRPAAVFALESHFDNFVLVPLDFAAQLLDYQNQRTAIEIMLQPEANPERIKNDLQQQLGTTFLVQTRDELNADLLRAIRIEKLFVTVALGLIVLVAAINIFFSLSMLVIEKRADMQMLFALGATPTLVRNIFLFEGAIVAFVGAVVGLFGGILACWLQAQYGWISMGMASSLVDAYPVKMQLNDIIVTACLVVIITILVSFVPAQRAAQLGEVRA
jgi:lipoprotein-releasing system permease protein